VSAPVAPRRTQPQGPSPGSRVPAAPDSGGAGATVPARPASWDSSWGVQGALPPQRSADRGASGAPADRVAKTTKGPSPESSRPQLAPEEADTTPCSARALPFHREATAKTCNAGSVLLDPPGTSRDSRRPVKIVSARRTCSAVLAPAQLQTAAGGAPSQLTRTSRSPVSRVVAVRGTGAASSRDPARTRLAGLADGGGAPHAEPVADVDARLEATIEALLDDRRHGASICPSEAARAVDPDGWRELMPAARAAAGRLAAAGAVEVTQGGEVVDVATARGPVRVRRPR
jgi:uncharacterized protein DUF3253